mmetsp:Transcript_3387/g.21167  ORF Transcript_3387/g.21167 Transcript_3387/m.21167 type:complete len:171 (-) Transcript_3387:745-1257(-)
MRWCSVQWPSSTTYEGVSEAGVSHGHGVVHFANGDRYEGEFRRGEMHGPGIYYWSEGAVHRGEWKRGVMNGCGVREEADKEPLVGEFVDDVYAGDAIGCSRMEAQERALEADYAAAVARAFELEPAKEVRRNASQPRRRKHVGVGGTGSGRNERESAAVANGSVSPREHQ